MPYNISVSLSLRYFIRLSYCGTTYNGWQNQPHAGTVTVQDTLEKAVSTYLRKKIELTGCGRTDTGVHARDYYAHFDITDRIGDGGLFIHRINKILPSDIAVHEVFGVGDDVHARFDAVSRSYEYHLHTFKSPFLSQSMYYPYEIQDFELLNQAAQIIIEFQDFTTFCKLHSDVKTMNCRITESFWVKNESTYTYKITSDRFLRGMIRLIVGMCLNVSSGKLILQDVRSALIEKRRTGHDWSVPAVGLILCDIKYPFL